MNDQTSWAIATTVMFVAACGTYAYLATEESRTEIAVANAFGENPCAILMLEGLAKRLGGNETTDYYAVYRECLNETKEAKA